MIYIKENEWDLSLVGCPSQCYYRFRENDGKRWQVYLRWRWNDPWTAELTECGDDWEEIGDGIDLLPEEERAPGVVTGFYREDELPILIEDLRKKLGRMFPGVVFNSAKAE